MLWFVNILSGQPSKLAGTSLGLDLGLHILNKLKLSFEMSF